MYSTYLQRPMYCAISVPTCRVRHVQYQPPKTNVLFYVCTHLLGQTCTVPTSGDQCIVLCLYPPVRSNMYRTYLWRPMYCSMSVPTCRVRHVQYLPPKTNVLFYACTHLLGQTCTEPTPGDQYIVLLLYPPVRSDMYSTYLQRPIYCATFVLTCRVRHVQCVPPKTNILCYFCTDL